MVVPYRFPSKPCTRVIRSGLPPWVPSKVTSVVRVGVCAEEIAKQTANTTKNIPSILLVTDMFSSTYFHFVPLCRGSANLLRRLLLSSPLKKWNQHRYALAVSAIRGAIKDD